MKVGIELLKQLLAHGNLTCHTFGKEQFTISLEKEITPEKLHELADWWKLHYKKDINK